MLSVPAVRDLLLAADEHEKPNPLDSVVKLQAVVSKTANEEEMTWAVTLLLDFYYSGALYLEQVGTRALQGKTHNSGGKGLVDLLTYKMQCLRYLVTEWLDALALPSSIKAALREACSTVEAFRAKCGYAYNLDYKKVSSSWRAGWQPSADHALELIEVTRDPELASNLLGFNNESCALAGMARLASSFALAVGCSFARPMP